jgi:hypothetical protein
MTRSLPHWRFPLSSHRSLVKRILQVGCCCTTAVAIRSCVVLPARTATKPPRKFGFCGTHGGRLVSERSAHACLLAHVLNLELVVSRGTEYAAKVKAKMPFFHADGS